MSKTDHDPIIEQCLRGDQQAQFALYDRYVTAMYNTAVRIMVNGPDAEDVIQESFIKVFQQLHTFRQEATIGSWIKRIVINTALNHLRNKKKLPFVEVPLLPERPDDIPDEEPAWDARTLHEAVKKLPEGSRVVFTLFAIEDMGHKDIARQLGIAESTSKTQYMRARRMLQQHLLSMKPCTTN